MFELWGQSWGMLGVLPRCRRTGPRSEGCVAKHSAGLGLKGPDQHRCHKYRQNSTPFRRMLQAGQIFFKVRAVGSD